METPHTRPTSDGNPIPCSLRQRSSLPEPIQSDLRIIFKGSSDLGNWTVCGGLIFLLCSAAASQTGAGWSKQSPATSPPPRFAHALAYDAAHSQVVLFGGENAANV